ncbi:MAG: hypothetical protein Q4C03_01375 [bacterium]|nr:hypothetical protein [bacterium]
MAVDKLVDSTQLDADLTSVANAIRTKGGTSSDLAFPAGFVSAVQAIPTGGGGSGVSGTFTPSSNLRSVTLTDCIGKTNIVIYPKFNLSTVSTRAHWGAVIIGGKTILQGSTNTSGNGYVFVATMSAETGAVSNPDTFSGTTGEVKIVASSNGNYGGYFLSGQTYGYIAW